MSRSIANGVDKLLKSEKDNRTETLSAGWKELRNKLDIMLLSNNVMKTNETTKACKAIDQMTHDERINYIAGTWGPLYAEKSMPILLQLQHIEKLMST